MFVIPNKYHQINYEMYFHNKFKDKTLNIIHYKLGQT
jgi:hypothetical protein